MSDPAAPSPPRHVAIIMDGNGRWARRRGLPRLAGHRAGAEALRTTLKAARELGIGVLTVYAFSSENWGRPPEEVDGLMRLLRSYLRAEIAELHANNVRFRVIGDRSRLARDITQMVDAAESLTAENTGAIFVVALSYGARDEMLRATRHLLAEVAAGRLSPEALDEARFATALDTAGLPDPDLIIRTGGDQRISNFLLWQAAYAELCFVDKYWPDFGADDLRAAIRDFGRRERRFGGLSQS